MSRARTQSRFFFKLAWFLFVFLFCFVLFFCLLVYYTTSIWLSQHALSQFLPLLQFALLQKCYSTAPLPEQESLDCSVLELVWIWTATIVWATFFNFDQKIFFLNVMVSLMFSCFPLLQSVQDSTECESGCQCPDGLLDDGNGSCVEEDDCPCKHDEHVYLSGTKISKGCNTWYDLIFLMTYLMVNKCRVWLHVLLKCSF